MFLFFPEFRLPQRLTAAQGSEIISEWTQIQRFVTKLFGSWIVSVEGRNYSRVLAMPPRTHTMTFMNLEWPQSSHLYFLSLLPPQWLRDEWWVGVLSRGFSVNSMVHSDSLWYSKAFAIMKWTLSENSDLLERSPTSWVTSVPEAFNWVNGLQRWAGEKPDNYGLKGYY